MNAANDESWQVLALRARHDRLEAFEHEAIRGAIVERSKRAEAWGTLYMAFTGLMLGAILGLFIRGL